MSAIEDLRELVGQLEFEYSRVRLLLSRSMNSQFGGPEHSPEGVLDSLGRPILLDMRIKILEARIVLAKYEVDNDQRSS